MPGRTRRIAIGVFADLAGANEVLDQLRRVGVHEPAIFADKPTPGCGSASPSCDLGALTALLPDELASKLAERIAKGSVAVYAEIGGTTTEKAVAEVLLASQADAVQLHDSFL